MTLQETHATLRFVLIQEGSLSPRNKKARHCWASLFWGDHIEQLQQLLFSVRCSLLDYLPTYYFRTSSQSITQYFQLFVSVPGGAFSVMCSAMILSSCAPL
jgi:hypothetical protein